MNVNEGGSSMNVYITKCNRKVVCSMPFLCQHGLQTTTSHGELGWSHLAEKKRVPNWESAIARYLKRDAK